MKLVERRRKTMVAKTIAVENGSGVEYEQAADTRSIGKAHDTNNNEQETKNESQPFDMEMGWRERAAGCGGGKEKERPASVRRPAISTFMREVG